MYRKYYLPLLFAQLFWLASAQAGSISGTITSRENGGPIAGAQIMATRVPFDSTFGNAVSDSSGNYTIHALLAGQYHVRAKFHDIVVEDSMLVTVTLDGNVSGINFQFGHPPVVISNSISGRITAAGSHLGIAGATAHLDFGALGTIAANADSNGYYAFTNINPGWYRFSASAEGYATFMSDHQIMVGSDTHISGLNAELRPVVTYQTLVTGHVYNSVTGDPIAGAVVFDNVITAHLDSMRQHFAWTDNTGAYSFKNLPTGNYTFSAHFDGFLTASVAGVTVSASETTVVDFHLVRPATGSISGTVTLGEGNPLRGARVHFVPARLLPSVEDHGAVTDSNGNYLARLVPGQYFVACSFERDDVHLWKWYSANGTDERTAVTVQVDSMTTGIDFNFTPPRHLHVVVNGQVTDASGTPLVGARVNAGIDSMLACSDNDGVASTRTDSNGNYVLTLDVRARDQFRFAMSARARGYQVQYYNGQSDPSKADIFTITSDSTISGVNFALDTIARHSNSISGTVTTSAGAPLANALVSAHGKITRRLKVAATDSLGNYTITDLFNERYIVQFSARGYVSEMYDNAHTWEDATPVLANGAVTGINASLEAAAPPDTIGGTLIGTVRDDHDTLLVGATVALVHDGHHVIRTTATLSDGSFSFTHLFPGGYTVIAAKAGYKSATAAVTVYGSDSGATSVDLVLEYKAPSAPITISGGWNIVSLPLQVSNATSAGLFPGFNGHLFSFSNNTYGSSDQMFRGRGYWMKNGFSAGYDIEGDAILAETVHVSQGWNLIGGLSLPVAVSTIQATTPGFVVSQFFGYNGSGYSATDTLYAGYGYWLKVATAGTLIIAVNPSPSAKPVNVVRTDDAPPAAPDVAGVSETRPFTFGLNQNYPNPFNPTTMIQYEIPASGLVTVKVYNLLGVEVATLINSVQDAGSHQLSWDASNLASGVYFYKLSASGSSTMKKMMLLR